MINPRAELNKSTRGFLQMYTWINPFTRFNPLCLETNP